MRINLHIHSRYSDGTLWPEELAARARATGLSCVALTDHDTTAGVQPFLRACQQQQIIAVPGIEVDCVAPEIDYDSELLGYFPRGALDRTTTFAEGRRQARERAARCYLARAEELYQAPLPFDAFKTFRAGGASAPGLRLAFTKVDVWRYLLHRQVLDPETSYGRFKESRVIRGFPGGPAGDEEVDRKPHVREVIDVIVADGGYPVLPHPGHMFGDDLHRMEQQEGVLADRLRFFREAGVWGLELMHYRRDRDEINDLLRRQASQHGFELTAGSDCHGPGSRSDTMALFSPDLELRW